MNAYLYVFDTLSDWEWGFITAELNTGRFFKERNSRIQVITIAKNQNAIKTMGGVTIMPDKVISEVHFGSDDLLILPGGETWLENLHTDILSITTKLLSQGITVAAICGATMALAQNGILDNYKHTSNDLSVLEQMCPAYKGSPNYISEPAVTDRNLITASGLAAVDFAYQILKKLRVFGEDTLDAWYKLHTRKESQYFFQLVQSLK